MIQVFPAQAIIIGAFMVSMIMCAYRNQYQALLYLLTVIFTEPTFEVFMVINVAMVFTLYFGSAIRAARSVAS